MRDALLRESSDADVVIGAAAVADYRVESPAESKRKRNGSALELKLTENPDLIAEIGAAKRPGQVIVGFAAETDNLLENAKRKLTKKSLDLIVANEVGTSDSGFGTDTVRAQILSPSGGDPELPLLSKEALAETLFDRIASLLQT